MTQIELEKSLHNDTIDMDTVADLEKMIERKKIEKLHRYKIFYNEKRDAWYTCHPLNYKRRIQRKTKEELLDALAPFLTVEIGNDMNSYRFISRMVGLQVTAYQQSKYYSCS